MSATSVKVAIPLKTVTSDQRLHGIATFTEVADTDTSADRKGQVQQIVDQAEATLTLVDSDKTRILAVTIYITDFANFDGLNEIWDSWFIEGTAPSRACVKAELVDPNLLVEMTFTAAAGEKFQS